MSGRELHEKCWRLMQQQRFAEAVKVAKNLCEGYPDRAEAWFSFSNAAKGARLADLALHCIDRAIELDGTKQEFLAHKSLCLVSVNKVSEAILLAKEVADKSPKSVHVLTTIASVFDACDEFESHLAVGREIIRLDPGNLPGLSQYALALRNMGELREAEDIYSNLIALDAHAYSTFYARSQTFTATEAHNYISELKEKVGREKLTWRAEMQLRFALAKELEDMGQYAESFENLSTGANLRRENSNYDVRNDTETIDKIIQVYGELAQNDTGYENDKPIFVMGLPRSGTTLVERILGGHSDVFAAGELQGFSSEMVKQIQLNTGSTVYSKLENVEASARLDWEALGRGYIDNTRSRTGHSRRFIDKMPSNYLYMGLIARALPQAKIILVERGPMDSCYAMYKSLFAEAYPFTYSLNDLGDYYASWKRLMQHWKDQLGDRVYTVKYEDMVTSTENAAHDLLKYCGLEWESDCLNFHEQKGGVSTASALQVRKPIYKTSLNKWRHYEKELKPLSDRLSCHDISV